MSADDLAVNDWAVNTEVEQLKAQVSALEELLEVYEQETLEKSSHLEKTLRELAYSEDALWILKSILSSMGDGVVVVDETGQFLFLNPDAQMLLGIESSHSSRFSEKPCRSRAGRDRSGNAAKRSCQSIAV